MNETARAFIEAALEAGALRFGRFTLKSGRSSPYFFNLGAFDSGERLRRLAGWYADALQAAALPFDMLFGPAYKGIPLVAATAVILAGRGHSVPFAFNRKEVKDHGEGGGLIGAPLFGRVLILDDVLTLGTSVRESVALIRGAGATPCGVLVALDRCEADAEYGSARGRLEAECGLPVRFLAALDDVAAYLETTGLDAAALAAIRAGSAF